MYDYEKHISDSLDSIVKFLESLNAQISDTKIYKGLFSSGEISLRGFLEDKLNELQTLMLELSKKQTIEPSNKLEFNALTTEVKKLTETVENHLNNIKKENTNIIQNNSLILKSISRLEQQNEINNIEAAIRDANNQYLVIVTNYRQKFLTQEEASAALCDISKRLGNLLANSNLSLNKFNYYVSLNDQFVSKCEKFLESCKKEKQTLNM